MGTAKERFGSIDAGGQSGGILVSEEGKVIGISGFRFSDAAFGLAASAADLLPRIRRLIDGEDVFGLGNRPSFVEIGQEAAQFTLRDGWEVRAFYVEQAGGPQTGVQVAGENDAAIFLVDLYGSPAVVYLFPVRESWELGDRAVACLMEK